MSRFYVKKYRKSRINVEFFPILLNKIQILSQNLIEKLTIFFGIFAGFFQKALKPLETYKY